MPFGLAGTNLEIDLSTGRFLKTEFDPEYLEMYLGGRGTSTRLFWERVPPETDSFSPENLLIFGTGILTGTTVPGANRTAVISRSPQTHLLTYSLLGGFWGAELKHAGYDTLIISGKSSGPVYLHISNDKIEIHDAGHLWGKDTRETQNIIQKELNNDKIQIACIGPAGENMVYSATIEHGSGSGASRAGIGAVMGKKNLKAIAVHGTRDLYLSKPHELNTLCHEVLKKTDRAKKYWKDWAYETGEWLLRDGVYGNLDKKMPFENINLFLEDYMNKFQARASACYNCGIGCKSVIELPGGHYSNVKCQGFFNFALACKIRDLTFSIKCYDLCEAYGLDVISTANYVAFAIDLFEKGILKAKDTDGLRLEWENKEVAFSLIEKIAKREGIGDVLANGVYGAARLIGNGAEEHAYHIKKLEPIPYHNFKPVSALRSSIADKPDMTRSEGFVAVDGIELSREWKEDYVKSGFFSYPKALEKTFIEDPIDLEEEYDKIVPYTSYDTDKNSLADCTGICIFWTGFWRYNPITVMDHVNFINYATGMNIDETRAMDIAKRASMMTRAYNVATGIRKKDDTVPDKYFQASPEPSHTPLERNKFNRMIQRYYQLRGWNSEGIPEKKECDRLGLHFVIEELGRLGIL